MVTRGLVAALLVLVPGCAHKTLVVPAEMRPPQTAPAGAPQAGRQGYTVRLTDGQRLWEMQLPDALDSYDLRVPLAQGQGMPELLTSADAELLRAEGADKTVAPATEPALAAAQRSLLGGLARVGDLYRAQRYEVALIELSSLEQAYPKEARIHAMKGSLYRRLGKRSLARTSWQTALALDPGDVSVAEALRELGEQGE